MFFIWLILVGILYCPFRTWGCGLLLKHGKSYLPIVPKTVAWAQHLLIIHILLPILSQHHIQPIVSACSKGDRLKGHHQLTFEFFSRICVVISPLPLLPPSSRDRFPFQNFVNFFDHIKCKNTMPFFAISNSSPFNFTP